jgi:alpha-1,2-mannosyltransferase
VSEAEVASIDSAHLEAGESATARSRRSSEIALAVAILTAALLPLYLWRFTFHGMPIDLAIYRAGGNAVLHHQTLYGPGFGGDSLPVVRPFTYPPSAALFFVLFAVIPKTLLRYLWLSLSFTSLLFLLRISFARALEKARHPIVVFAVVVAPLTWIVPDTDTLWFGQINLILAALVVFDLLNVRKHRGILTGLATVLKVVPGLFIVYFALTRQWRAALRALATVAVLFTAGAIVLPSASARYFTDLLFKVGRPGPPTFFSNQALNGFLRRVHSPHWLWIPLGIAIAVIGFRKALEAHQRGNETTAVVLVGLIGLLVAPISWLATAVWVAPAIGLILGSGTDRRRVLAAIGLVALFIARLPMLGDKIDPSGWLMIPHFLMVNSYVFVITAMLIWMPLDLPATRTRPPAVHPRARASLPA